MIAIPAKYEGRAALSPKEAAEVLGIGRVSLYRHVMPAVRSGAIQSLMIGGSRRILLASLLRWVERQSDQATA